MQQYRGHATRDSCSWLRLHGSLVSLPERFDVVIVAFSALEVVIDLFAQTLAASMSEGVRVRRSTWISEVPIEMAFRV